MEGRKPMIFSILSEEFWKEKNVKRAVSKNSKRRNSKENISTVSRTNTKDKKRSTLGFFYYEISELPD